MTELKCLFYLLTGVIIAQAAPVDREMFDFSIFNSSDFQNDFSKIKNFQPPPTLDPKIFEDLNKIHEEVFREPEDRNVIEYRRPSVAAWFVLRIFIGVVVVAVLGCVICFKQCCKRRTVGILHRESILVVVAPSRNRAEEQQPVADPAATPPPSYDEAVVIPPLPTAEELKAKRQTNQSTA